MSGRLLGTVLAVVVLVAAVWLMRKAGNALRDTIKKR